MTADILLTCVSTVCAAWAVALARKSTKTLVTLTYCLAKRNGRLVVRASCRNGAQRAVSGVAIKWAFTMTPWTAERGPSRMGADSLLRWILRARFDPWRGRGRFSVTRL